MPSTTSLSIHHQTVLTLQSRPKSLQRFTMQVQDAVRESRVITGLCCLFLRHTSASLVIQENADPSVLMDMETFLSKLVPEGADYRHRDEWASGSWDLAGNLSVGTPQPRLPP